MGELTSNLAVVEFIPGSELARIDFQSAGQIHNNFEFAALDAALRLSPLPSLRRHHFMLLHLIALALFVGSIAVPLCLLRFVYRFVKTPATRR